MKTITLLTDPQLISALDAAQVVACDIDHTLIDFDRGQEAATREIAKAISAPFAKEMNAIFLLLLAGYRGTKQTPSNNKTYQAILQRIYDLQDDTPYGKKMWSREAMAIVAAQNINIAITPAQVEQTRDVYWGAIGDFSPLYPDAKKFIEEVKKRTITLFFTSGSDAILSVRSHLTLHYDPTFSESYKQKRLVGLPHARKVFIADPEGKINPAFYDRVEKTIFTITHDKLRVLFVGDSYTGDIQEPEKRGYKTYLIKRE
ncbi:hypothetical protein KC726_03185 [Candidatus Woesebacteria bacterium]|nr:hypothetical protein [Candidatus Woesebacteria bacterium]